MCTFCPNFWGKNKDEHYTWVWWLHTTGIITGIIIPRVMRTETWVCIIHGKIRYESPLSPKSFPFHTSATSYEDTSLLRTSEVAQGPPSPALLPRYAFRSGYNEELETRVKRTECPLCPGHCANAFHTLSYLTLAAETPVAPNTHGNRNLSWAHTPGSTAARCGLWLFPGQ